MDYHHRNEFVCWCAHLCARREASMIIHRININRRSARFFLLYHSCDFRLEKNKRDVYIEFLFVDLKCSMKSIKIRFEIQCFDPGNKTRKNVIGTLELLTLVQNIDIIFAVIILKICLSSYKLIISLNCYTVFHSLWLAYAHDW